MGYYQGDYYRGDYYQGSPLALIGGALKLGSKLLKPAARLGKKAVSAVKTVFAKPGVKKGVGIAVGTGISVPTVISIGGKKSVDEAKTEAMISAPGGGGGVHGPRLDRDGNPCAKKYGGRGCSHRMNVTNPRALRRSIRRARGFAKLARKVLSFPISKPPRGRALFKAKKR